MKGRIATLAFFMLIGAVLRLQAQGVEKTLVQSLNPGASPEVMLDLAGSVEIREWDNKIIRIQTTIQIHNSSGSTLQALIQAGRYSTKGVTEGTLYLVSIPGLEKEVNIGGVDLQESFSYVVYVPKGLSIAQPEQAAASYKP